MNLRMTRFLKNFCYILACIAALGGLLPAQNSLRLLCLGAAVVLFLLAIVLTAVFYNCPHCKRVLPKGRIPEKCPHCGKPLQ